MKWDVATVRREALAGLTTSFAMVPETVGFAFVAHLNPLAGLYASFVGGLVAALVGGRPAMVTGGAGSVAVVSAALVLSHGTEYLFAALLLMGAIQIAVGVLKLGRLIEFVPHPVMLGFVNGLAIVIFLAQLRQIPWQSSALSQTLLIVAVTISICVAAPRVWKAVPPALIAIGAATGLAMFAHLGVARVANLAVIQGGLSAPRLPLAPPNLNTISVVFPYALILSAVGLSESLLTQALVNEVTGTRSSYDRECVGQGLANIFSGMFQGMGTCAMIGQTVINLDSGGRTRLSGVIEALSILAFLLFASPVIRAVPIGALVGVMCVVVVKTFSWTSIKDLARIPRSDAAIILVVTSVTVFKDLATAVFIGVLLSSLAFVWKASKLIAVKREELEGRIRYEVQGLLFFGSSAAFMAAFEPETDSPAVEVDLSRCHLMGYSASEALERVSERYRRQEIGLAVTGLSEARDTRNWKLPSLQKRTEEP